MMRFELLKSGLAAMAGTRKKTGSNAPKPKAKVKATPPPPKPADEELYEAGDICAPEPDRDDEQRDL
jgi:hypothetical protein